MTISTDFRGNYKVEIADELPSSGVGVRYFRAVEAWQSQIYETTIKFSYAGQPAWWGVFSARSKGEEGISLTSTMPHPDCCVVSCLGTGYVVNVAEPEEWHFVEVRPVLRIEALLEQQLLLLNDFNRIAAYGIDGLSWRSDVLCSDQLKIVRVGERFIECSGWDAASDDEIVLRVDSLTGELKR